MPIKKISLFIPCLVDQFMPEVGVAVYNIFKELGYEVNYPEKQTCCGQPAFNTGFRREARKVAIHFLETFKNEDIIVSPSGSCVSMVRNHYESLDLPSEFLPVYDKIKKNIFEFTEFLVLQNEQSRIEGSYQHSVVIHDSCHGLRELGLENQTSILLKRLKNIKLVDIPWGKEDCCGFGGTFSVAFSEIAHAMVSRKSEALIESGADFVVAGDAGCIIHIGNYLKTIKSQLKPLHIASVLAQAMGLNTYL